MSIVQWYCLQGDWVESIDTFVCSNVVGWVPGCDVDKQRYWFVWPPTHHPQGCYIHGSHSQVTRHQMNSVDSVKYHISIYWTLLIADLSRSYCQLWHTFYKCMCGACEAYMLRVGIRMILPCNLALSICIIRCIASVNIIMSYVICTLIV